MKKCPHCHEEVDDEFDVCWNCNYSFSEQKVLLFEDDAALATRGELKINCLRCVKVQMKSAGTFDFHEGRNFGVLGNLFELLNNKASFELYVCPACGKVEFYSIG